jgi:NTP pyrophosphatase (non-canonical NTP hydrolase)
MFDFEKFSELNKNRCDEVFHKLEDWSYSDWGNAMAGECGEACNKIKKLRREENINKKDIAEEVADVAIYADLLCTRLGYSLSDLIKEKFNKVSDKRGSKIKIE